MPATHAPARLGLLWQQRVRALREYDVVRDGNAFGSSLGSNVVYSSEYDSAQHLLAALIGRYQGIPIAGAISGSEISNEEGTCFRQMSEQTVEIPAFDRDRLRSGLLEDLMLVRGVGPKIQARLRSRGFSTVLDLEKHPRFSSDSRQVLQCLSGGTSSEIMNLIGSRHTKSHPFALGTAGFHEPGDYVFLDIETLGLFSRPVILIGIGTISYGKLAVHQYLLRDISEEPAALSAALDHLSGERTALVTFNGKSFDLPYLTERFAYYGMDPPTGIPHFDILPFSRRRWKDQLSSMRLTILEREILGIVRDEDIPGQMVPEFYEAYLRTGNCGPLVPIMNHNRQDVISLALLFFYLMGECYGSQ